jgi:hypothetical protein
MFALLQLPRHAYVTRPHQFALSLLTSRNLCVGSSVAHHLPQLLLKTQFVGFQTRSPGLERLDTSSPSLSLYAAHLAHYC